MSSVLLLAAACTLHVGGPPSAGFWVSQVEAPVAEPNIDIIVLDAVETRLAAGGAFVKGGTALALLIERADWSPSRRDGDALVYAARLRVRAAGVDATRTCELSGEVLAPTSGNALPATRAAVFQSLAERCAAELVAWFVLAPAPAPLVPGAPDAGVLSPPTQPPPTPPPPALPVAPG